MTDELVLPLPLSFHKIFKVNFGVKLFVVVFVFDHRRQLRWTLQSLEYGSGSPLCYKEKIYSILLLVLSRTHPLSTRYLS